MSRDELAAIYHGYIRCLNERGFDRLGSFVQDDAHYNGRPVGLAGYRDMLEGDVRAIPDLQFEITMLVCEPPRVASRLHFDCTPAGMLFGLPVNGKRVRFDENVFYQFRDSKIASVWSIIDKAAIASQL